MSKSQENTAIKSLGTNSGAMGPATGSSPSKPKKKRRSRSRKHAKPIVNQDQQPNNRALSTKKNEDSHTSETEHQFLDQQDQKSINGEVQESAQKPRRKRKSKPRKKHVQDSKVNTEEISSTDRIEIEATEKLEASSSTNQLKPKNEEKQDSSTKKVQDKPRKVLSGISLNQRIEKLETPSQGVTSGRELILHPKIRIVEPITTQQDERPALYHLEETSLPNPDDLAIELLGLANSLLDGQTEASFELASTTGYPMGPEKLVLRKPSFDELEIVLQNSNEATTNHFVAHPINGISVISMNSKKLAGRLERNIAAGLLRKAVSRMHYYETASKTL